MNLIGQLFAATSVPEKTDARSCGDLLSRLSGLLQIHFAMEDRSLYPLMLVSQDALTARTAHKFQSEMGDLSPTFSQFMNRWREPNAIQDAADTFACECRAVLMALQQRIEREDRELYKLADALYSPGTRIPAALASETRII